MCTIVFTNNPSGCGLDGYHRLYIYHGNHVEVTAHKHLRYKDSFGRDCVDYRSFDSKEPQIDIPCYGDPLDGNLEKLKHDSWEYRVYDPDSEDEYVPICIDNPERRMHFMQAVIKFGCKNHNELLSKMFNIPDFNELIRYSKDTGIDTFVVARNIPIWLTCTEPNQFTREWGGRTYVLTTSKPHTELMTWPWKDRFACKFPRVCKGDPMKYSKIYSVGVPVGDDGLCYTEADFCIDDGYPNCDNLVNDFNNHVPIDWGQPYKIPEKVKTRRAEKEKQKQIEKEKLELQKTLDGYCDECGAPNAEHIINPYGFTGWLCYNCYKEMNELWY